MGKTKINNKGVTVEKITLKLTKEERGVLGDAIVNKSGYCYNGINECAGILSFENSRNCSQFNTIYQYCNIQDADKFREFLNDAILNQDGDTDRITAEDFYTEYNHLKSIVSKLDKEVK